MKLTDRSVKAVEVPDDRAHIVWDDELRGFGLRVYPTGARAFVYRYTSPETDKRRLLTLGEYGPMTVAKARTKAEKYRGRVLEGEDPAPDRQGDKPLTVDAFADIYVDRMAPRWSERTKAEYERQIARHVKPSLGSARLDTITRAQVAGLLDKIGTGSGKYEANRVHSLIRAMFNRARRWGFLPDDQPNPARGVERYRETPRERWLKPDEVEALMAAVRKQENIYFRSFVPLALLSGMRSSELLRLQWEHVNLKAGEVLLLETKSGKPQVRVLSEPAVQILRFVPRQKENPFVFPGRMTGTHRKSFRNEWAAAREEAGLSDVTLHDLRRTAGSYMAQAGVSLQVIAEVLGHQGPAVTKVYARLAEENERQAVEALGEKLAGLIGA